MTVAQSSLTAPCRFRGEHPTVVRPASRKPLVVGMGRMRTGAMCLETRRGLRASSRPRLRDARARRPASRLAPTKRSS
jgi:hypothetical protein